MNNRINYSAPAKRHFIRKFCRGEWRVNIYALTYGTKLQSDAKLVVEIYLGQRTIASDATPRIGFSSVSRKLPDNNWEARAIDYLYKDYALATMRIAKSKARINLRRDVTKKLRGKR